MNARPQTRAEREDALACVDSRLRADPLSVEHGLERARLLGELDRGDEARDAYLRLLARVPDDARVLNDFGTFLLRAGFRAAARTTYERALAVAPSALAHANLGNVLFADLDYAGACRHYEAALALEPDHAAAHQGLSYALTRLGRGAEAELHRALGFAGRAVTTAAYRGSAEPIDVLLCVSAAGGTLYTDTFLDDRIFRTTTLVVDAYDGTPLPRADVAFNAIADADRAADELLLAEQLLRGLGVRIVNPPERVRATGRVANAARLRALAGVRAPRITAVRRDALGADAAGVAAREGFTFPLLVRAPGYHTGEHFAYAADAPALARAAATLPGSDALLIEFADLRDAFGAVRKYRVMAVGGRLYPLHLAIARDWKVHYFTADMDDARHRAEDAAFLADPVAAIGVPAWAALGRIAELLQLDYAGIDFGIDADGRVVVFEANATMIVLPPPAAAIWNYRRAAVARIVAAVQALLT